ncbi:hypothetical protein B0T17DRAFT_534086 [Bombardia bombarda]|uniref:Uncharacterized protein n=1 Tax=Bombardia bombarda TaxID=252184 RepID=A0AA39WTQ6_9PEZI|nr:hypothetical protein B0T17DRAFT_534086 [Bombardia bombarda]
MSRVWFVSCFYAPFLPQATNAEHGLHSQNPRCFLSCVSQPASLYLRNPVLFGRMMAALRMRVLCSTSASTVR